jgi:phosphatidylinositol N-acetylglucosaminyltransferase subunit P
MSVTSEEDDKDLSDNENQFHGSSSSDGEGSPPPPLQQNYFAPPFYGRPPTPLPPSPSLTSLLRPSRPTTPDASDDDFEPLPRASPIVPTYEYYGFVLHLFASLTFLIYLLWSYLPSPFLHALGIYYYPNRWWSLAIPAFLVMTLVYIYVALASYNREILTLPMVSIETIVDETSKVAVVDSKGRIRDGPKKLSKQQHRGSYMNGYGLNWRNVWNEGTDAVMDVPLAGVCEVLYGENRDMDSDEESLAS